MKRIYHHYLKWEEHIFGMWIKVSKAQEIKLLKKAIKFTGDHKLYGSFMKRIIKEWPISCEQNLSHRTMNRQAWIGHAATCLAIKCPEYITRLAWHNLSQNQQDLANGQADKAIALWEKRYAKN